MNFSTRLKDLRKGTEISQTALGKEIGVTLKQIQRYESGENEPTMSVLVRLSRYFGVTIDFLVGKSDLPDYSASEDTAPFPMMCIRLRQLREAKGLDVFYVAEMIKDSPRNYAGYEEGEVLPRLRTICALADFFDVSLDFLTGRNNNPNSHKL